MNNKNKIFTLITIFAISIVFLVGCGDNDEKHNSKNEESLSDVETTTIEKETPETTTCTEETTIVKETTTVTEETTKKRNLKQLWEQSLKSQVLQTTVIWMMLQYWKKSTN